MENTYLKTDSGLVFSVSLDREKNLLSIGAKDETRGIDLCFITEDCIDDTYYVNAVWGPYNPVKGKKLFFHEGTRLYEREDGSVELRSCPIDRDTGEPMAAFLVHYRFETIPGVDGLRISSWFTKREPVTAETLNWLNFCPKEKSLTTLVGFNPDCKYEIDSVPQSLRFPTAAIEGTKGWAALTQCGEAMLTPGHIKPHEAEEDIPHFYFRPQATIANQVNLTLYGKSNPLTATLLVGSGDIELPDLPIQEYPEAIRPRGEDFSLESGKLKLTIKNRVDGCSILPMDTGDWSPIQNRVAMAPIARLLVKNLETGEMQTISSEAGWKDSRVKSFEDSLKIYLQEPDGIEDFALSIEIRATRENRLEWHTKVLNTNPNYTVLYATYPSVNFEDLGAVEGEDDSLVLFTPKDSGSLIESPRSRGYHYNGFYPHGVETPMGYMGLYNRDRDKDNGLYVGIHDTGGSRKEMTTDFSTQGSGCFEFVCIAENINRPANAFDLPGVMVWEIFSGDWYDMTCIYRDFIISEAPWMPLHGRKDSPQWMRDVPLYIIARMPAGDNPAILQYPKFRDIDPKQDPDDWYKKPIELAEKVDMPIVYHLYDWHWCPFDNDYPNYFPVKEGLKEGVQKMQEHDIYVMPYINGRLWDTHDRRGEDYRFTRDALDHTSKKNEGRPYTEFYNSFEPNGERVELAVMCPSTWRWRDEMLKVTSRLCNEYGVNGVYLDQISCAVQSPCEDPSHNHVSGNGSWWRESYKLLMERIRAEAPEGCGFTSESNAEIFTDQFDGFLTWTWLNSNLVPAFPLIYSGYVAMFGRSSDRVGEGRDEFARYHFTQSLMFGQQIGWINPGVVDNEDLLPCLKEIAGYRYKYRSYFNEGDMLRPPMVQDGVPRLITHSGMGDSMMFEGDMIMSSAWRRRKDEKVLIMLANVSDEDMDCNFTMSWEEYGIDPEDLKVIDGKGILDETYQDGLRVKLPSKAFLILECQ